MTSMCSTPPMIRTTTPPALVSTTGFRGWGAWPERAERGRVIGLTSEDREAHVAPRILADVLQQATDPFILTPDPRGLCL